MIGALTLTPAASAYKLPGKPGTPGGPPTKAKGGTGASKGAANKVAIEFAGDNGSELAAKGSFSVQVHLPKAGTVGCQTASGSTSLGSGSTSRKKAGNATLMVKFTTEGIAFLNSHSGQAIPVTISCTFKPKKGKSSHSTATVTLNA